jgi:hypothetical protein
MTKRKVRERALHAECFSHACRETVSHNLKKGREPCGVARSNYRRQLIRILKKTGPYFLDVLERIDFY